MRFDDLRLLEVLDFRPQDGTIFFGDRRMLVFDADALGHLRKELIQSVGEDAARGILTRFGWANGYRDALTLRERFSFASDADWWAAGPVLHTMEGKVQAVPERVVFDKERRVFECEILWNRSAEAEQHLRHIGPSQEPACWMLAGYGSGMSTACFGEEVYFVEEECLARGDARCRVVGRTRRAWGDAIASRLGDFQATSMKDEMARLVAEIQRASREIEDLKSRASVEEPGLVARSRAMQAVLDLARRVAASSATVLLTGESGTGKERVARFVHERSPRKDGPFLAINCGAMPEALLESELFGHVRGAFTGAVASKQGLFEAARGGTLLLDEIGEAPLSIQAKLLRVVQDKEVRPVGGNVARKVDVRLVAATNRDLRDMVEKKQFRDDLYYRLKVVTIDVPPLRARREDLLPLARLFARRACEANRCGTCALSPEALDLLLAYPWPGNVRELENAVERAVILAEGKPRIMPEDLPPEVRQAPASPQALLAADGVLALEELERRYILLVLKRAGGNRARAARELGIGMTTLWRKLRAWGVPRGDNGAGSHRGEGS